MVEETVVMDEVLTDDELRERVYYVLNHTYPPLRELLLPIAVEVEDGVVTLKGWVRTPAMKHMATKLALEVPGVKDVRNQLIADDELEREVALALERDPALEDDFPGIFVDALAGAVTLWGHVSSEENKARAQEIAQSIHGVRKVINDLKVKGAHP